MTKPLINLTDITQNNNINKNQQKQADFSLNFAESVFYQDLNNNKQNNNIFKNEKLIDSYNLFKNAEFSHDQKKIKEKADNFTANFLTEDLKDDGKINLSIFKEGKNWGNLSQITKDIFKDDLPKIIFNPYKQDDGMINGTKISNKENNVQNHNIFNSLNPLISQGGVTSLAVNNALNQIGKKESDGSYKEFTQGRREAWCADFVSWAYEKSNGGKCPWGYRDGKNYTSAVSEIANWGRKNSLYMKNNEQSRNNLNSGDLILTKKPSDHIGIITRVDKDTNGRVTAIHSIEGNTTNKVAERTYSVSNRHITGFIDMNKWQSNLSTFISKL